MDTESRMKEISQSLKRDVKDLLGESANIVTGIFKQGWCTVQGIGDKWKAFAREVSGAVENLIKPAFLEGGTEAPSLSLDPEGQPIVTVMESTHEHLPVGKRMTLSEVDAQMQVLGESFWDSGESSRPVTVAIDYMMDGQNDRYWLPLQVGICPPLLEQMKDHVNSCLANAGEVAQLFEEAPAPLQAILHDQFGPQLHADLEKLSTRVIGLFRQHLNIAKLEQQFDAQASVMPEKKQAAFRQAMSAAVVELRRAANTGEETRPAAERVRLTPMAEQTEKPRQSVKVHLRQLTSGKAQPHKKRSGPER